MKELFIKDDTTLTAKEFYDKYKTDDSNEDLDIFRDLSDEEFLIDTITGGKPIYRPIAAANDVITVPPKSHEELVSCFRERLHLRSNLKHTSVADQRVLVDILIMAIISIWPEHRKQAPDPFMTDIGNIELQRRVAVHVIEVVEDLFYKYVLKAEELNAMKIFSCAANLCRLKTQILQEADTTLDILKVRRKLAEEMRLYPKRGWLLEPKEDQLYLDDRGDDSENNEELIHRQTLDRQYKELLTQMPNLTESQRKGQYEVILRHINSTIKQREQQQQAEKSEKNESIVQEGQMSSFEKEESILTSPLPKQFDKEITEDSDDWINRPPRLKRVDSMPLFEGDVEVHEEFKEAKGLTAKRRLSVNQCLINGPNATKEGKNNTSEKLTPREDLEMLLAREIEQEEKSATVDDDFSPLLQVQNLQKRRIRKTNIIYPVNVEESQAKEKENSEKRQIYSEQPPILNVKVPNEKIVRISDARISNRQHESKLTLHKHPTIYNEFLDEIDDETAWTLDHHLSAGAEVRDVYAEITKTLKKTYLEFDQDDFVEDCATSIPNKQTLFVSGLLHDKHQQHSRIVNDTLKVNKVTPWKEFSNADEWRNEPKFAGIGREDMLKINGKADLKTTRQSMFMADTSFISNGQLAKSYSSWLMWYRNNINVDDYKKFISSKDTDYLCEIFHLYDSDDGGDDNEEAAMNSAQVLLMKKREEKLRQLWAQKEKYETGFWNAQCVSLGGLGRNPSLLNMHVENSEDKVVESSSTENEDRLECIWKSLKMPDHQRVNMAIKHSAVKSLDKLAQMVEYWECVSELIESREHLMMKLETFERTASDPNRFFEKGPNGSSEARFNESNVRKNLNKQIKKLDEEIIPLLNVIKNFFNDDVTYQGRVYALKIQSDRVEMLYWLQQERRQQRLDEFGSREQNKYKSVTVTVMSTY